MAYPHQSIWTGDITESIARLFVMDHKWMVLNPECRDSVYDFAVQFHNKISTIQVKSLSKSGSFKTTNRARSSKESVSDGGKARNCFRYADRGVEWMMGVDVPTKSVFCYPIDVYKNYDVINVNKVGSCDFPYNDKMISNAAATDMPTVKNKLF